MINKFLIITGIVVLSMTLLGFWGYDKYFKPDPVIEQQLTDQFGEEFFTSFDEEEIVNNPEQVNNVQSVVQSVEEKVNKQVEGKEVTTTPANENSVVEMVTQDDISNKYKDQFNHLQNVALSRLDTLYSAAIQEYKQGSKAGTLSRSELAQKYLQAGKILEANMDKQFYGALSTMEAELKANHLSTDSVDVYKNEYEKAKSDKRGQLFAKVQK